MGKLRSQCKLESIEADFGEGPVTVYWRPMNMREMDQIAAGSKKSNAAGLVETLLIRARKSDGHRMFDSRDDHPDRLKVETDFDPDEIIRVVLAMVETDTKANEEAGN